MSGLVQDGLLKAAASAPDRVALVSGDQTFTFQQLAARATRFAARIASIEEVGAAPRVALCLSNSPAVVDAFFGTLMAEGCVCLFDPDWPRSLLIDLLADHTPDVLVASDELLNDLSGELGIVATISTGAVLEIVQDGGEGKRKEFSATPDSPFLIGFTSGSSGKPKAFIRSHKTWIESFHHSAKELGTAAGDCVLAPGPLSHGLSLYAVVEALCAGATVIIQSKFNVVDTFQAIGQQSVSSLVVVPTMLDAVLSETGGQSYAGLTRIITAGAKLPSSLRARTGMTFPNADIIEYYGASELSFISLAKGSESVPPDSVGRPFSGVEISIRNDAGAKLRATQVGTVWVRSDMICTGYVGPTDGSGLRKEDEWATVGDLGHVDEKGFLFLAGREGSAITSGGYTVYPSAIENALLSHPGVADAAVIGLPHAKWGEVIAAAIVPKSGQPPTEEDLSAHCHESLEPYACPRLWLFAENLERTPSGKIKRATLADLFVGLEF